jgi:hypothetical protein
MNPARLHVVAQHRSFSAEAARLKDIPPGYVQLLGGDIRIHVRRANRNAVGHLQFDLHAELDVLPLGIVDRLPALHKISHAAFAVVFIHFHAFQNVCTLPELQASSGNHLEDWATVAALGVLKSLCQARHIRRQALGLALNFTDSPGPIEEAPCHHSDSCDEKEHERSLQAAIASHQLTVEFQRRYSQAARANE